MPSNRIIGMEGSLPMSVMRRKDEDYFVTFTIIPGSGEKAHQCRVYIGEMYRTEDDGILRFAGYELSHGMKVEVSGIVDMDHKTGTLIHRSQTW